MFDHPRHVPGHLGQEGQRRDSEFTRNPGRTTLTQELLPGPGISTLRPSLREGVPGAGASAGIRDGGDAAPEAGELAALWEDLGSQSEGGDEDGGGGGGGGGSVDGSAMSFGPEDGGQDGDQGGDQSEGHAGDHAGEQADAGGAKTAKGGRDQAAQDPTQIAEDGFLDPASELPYRHELEQSFGMSFAGVRAYRGSHARQACEALGADAYTVGHRIAFASSSPGKDVVAHELTHVVQHAGGGAAKQTGVETAGEHEAEHVERAVGAGKPAHAAMAAGSHAHRGAHGVGGPVQRRAPNLKANPKFGVGMTFGIPSSNSSTVKKGYEYRFWEPEKGIEMPIAALPGLNFIVEPGLKVVAEGGLGKKQRGRVGFGVIGEIGVGFSYGNSKVVAAYGKAKGTASGSFVYSRGAGDWWQAAGGLSIDSSIEIGVRAGAGIFQTSIESPSVQIGKLAGIEFEKGKLKTAQLGWTWGPVPNGIFKKIDNAIKNAEAIAKKGAEAAKKAWGYIKKNPDMIFLPGPTLAKKLVSALGDLFKKVLPFV